MQISQLKYFQAVCMFGSTTRAAEVLYVSQPSVSSAISKLESEFGVTLFDRSGNRLVLTDEGKACLHKVNAILNQLSDLEKTMFRLSNPDMLYISIPPVVNFMVPQMLNQYGKKNPDLHIKIYEDIQEEILPLILNNQRDLAIIVTDTITTDEFDIFPLTTAELLFYTNKNNPLARRENITVEDLAGVPLVMLKNSYYQTSLLEERFHKAGIEPLVHLHASQLSTVYSYIKEGYASGCMLGRWQVKGEVAVLPFNPPLRVNIGVIRKKGQLGSKHVQSIIRYLQKSFCQMEPTL